MSRRRDVPDVAFLVPLLGGARIGLGPAAYAEAFAAGRTLSYDDAVAEMTQWLRTLTTADALTTASAVNATTTSS